MDGNPSWSAMLPVVAVSACPARAVPEIAGSPVAAWLVTPPTMVPLMAIFAERPVVLEIQEPPVVK